MPTFPYLNAAAAPSKVRAWRIASGVTSGTGVSVNLLIPHLKRTLPEGMIIDQFMHIALAVALVGGLALLFFPRVATVGLAQNGVATSIMLMAAGCFGAVPSDWTPFVRAFLGCIACFLLLVMSGGLGFLRDQKQYADLTLGIILQAPFVFLWLYPIFHPLH